MALITPDKGNPHGKIDPEQFHSPADIENEAALQLVVQDAAATEAWMNNNYWVLRWREADALYQSPPGITMWEGTTVPRSNVNRFVVAETVNAIHPQVMNGLFYENPPFVLRPRPNEDQNTTRAISSLLALQLDAMEMRNEVDWGLFSALNFGTGIWKWGYKSYTKKVRKYVRVEQPITVPSTLPGVSPTKIETPKSVQFKRIDVDEEFHEPTFENKDIRHMLVDPGLQVPDITKAKFVEERMYMTYKDLVMLQDEEYVFTDPVTQKQSLKKRYNLPSPEEIKSWFTKPKEEPLLPSSNVTFAQSTTFVHHAKPQFEPTTEDPLNEPLEVLERWDNDKVITVIQRVKVIRNEPNEFGCIPFLSVNWWNINAAFWGIGLGRTIGVEQRVQAGLINACLDLSSLIVNPMWLRARGGNAQEQQIRQRIGGIVTVDAPNGKLADQLQMMQQPEIPAAILEQIGLSEKRVEVTSGANQQLTMGAAGSGKGAGGQMGRSGTGAAGIIQATMNRIGGFAEMFVRQVYEPLLYRMHELNKDKTPMDYIQKVLGDELGKDFNFDPSDFMQAPTEFEVLAGSHLAAKAQMAQSLFMMLQLFENAPLMEQLNNISGNIVDIEELFHMVHDISGWKNYYKIIRKMTPEEEKAKQAQSVAAQQQSKFAQQSQLQSQKFGQDQQIIDQENEARITRDVFRHIAEASVMPEALSGQPPTQGVGSEETG